MSLMAHGGTGSPLHGVRVALGPLHLGNISVSLQHTHVRLESLPLHLPLMKNLTLLCNGSHLNHERSLRPSFPLFEVPLSGLEVFILDDKVLTRWGGISQSTPG